VTYVRSKGGFTVRFGPTAPRTTGAKNAAAEAEVRQIDAPKVVYEYIVLSTKLMPCLRI